MILWCLRGYTDPEGEFEGGEVECAIEHAEDGYRLLVSHETADHDWGDARGLGAGLLAEVPDHAEVR